MVKLDIKTYERPKTLKAAYDLLFGDGTRQIMAGGAWQRLSEKPVDVMVGLEQLGLDSIEEDDKAFKIGAMTSLRSVEMHDTLSRVCDGILSQAVGDILGVPFRNTATIGGSVMGRYPFSDVITPLLALDAELDFFKRGRLTLESFLAMKRPEIDILTHIIVPKAHGHGYFKKVSNTRLDFSILNLAVTNRQDNVNIVIGSRPSKALKATEAMHVVNTASKRDHACFEQASDAVLKEISFGSNARASADYRKQLAKTYTMRGLKAVHHDDH